MGRRKLKYARSNIRFWHIADSYGLLKVRCERGAAISCGMKSQQLATINMVIKAVAIK